MSATLLTRLANRLSEMDGKIETVKELSKAFDCPYTSVYIPIHELESCGFLWLERGKGIIHYETKPLLLSSEQNDAVSDTTEDDQGGDAGKQKN